VHFQVKAVLKLNIKSIVEDENALSNPKFSMFDRLQSSTFEKRRSVFTRIIKGKDHKISYFNGIQGGSHFPVKAFSFCQNKN